MSDALSDRERDLAQRMAENPMDLFQGKSVGWLEDFIRITVGGKNSGWTPPVGTFLSIALDLTANTSEYIYTDSNGVNWLYWNGAAVSRTTYADLFNFVVPLLGTFTVTIASPAVFTLTSHNLVVGDRVYLTTTGALPTGLAQNTIYYVSAVPTSSTFRVSATDGGASINTSGSQSGTHSIYSCPFGLGDGSTTFNLGDCRGRALFYNGTGSGANMGDTDGVAVASRTPAQSFTPSGSVSVNTSGLTLTGTVGSTTQAAFAPGGASAVTAVSNGTLAVGGSATGSFTGDAGTVTAPHIHIGSLLVRF